MIKNIINHIPTVPQNPPFHIQSMIRYVLTQFTSVLITASDSDCNLSNPEYTSYMPRPTSIYGHLSQDSKQVGKPRWQGIGQPSYLPSNVEA